MMKKLLERFEVAMSAVAFAEAGEVATARELLKEDAQREAVRPLMRRNTDDGKMLRADQLYGETGK